MPQIVNTAGLKLDLGTAPKIPVIKYNPLFNNPDKLFQDVSYEFAAPITENNIAFLGFGHRVEASNKTYTLEVVLLVQEFQLKGLLKYRVAGDGFRCNLKPNLTAVNNLVKNAYLTDIRTYDVDYTDIWNNTALLESIMLDSCVNPDKHNAIYFPVKNTGYTVSERPYYEFMNNYNRDTGKFISKHPTADYFNERLWANVPYYKLTYIIKNISQFLGFEPVGDFFTDPTYKNYCIETRWSFARYGIYPSMSVMPYMLIADFIKQIRERLHLAFDFDLATGQLNVETFKSIKSSTEPFDLTPYLTDLLEQELTEENGVSVTLKSDDTDNALAVELSGETTYPPLFRLVAGSGEKGIELECSSIKTVDVAGDGSGLVYPEVQQTMMLNGFNRDDFPLDDYATPGTSNKWSLRLLNYKGYHLKADGKYWPDATGVELNDDDIEYYRFLNDRKQLMIVAAIPPAVLAGLKTTRKYCARSASYNYYEFILDRIEYDITDATDLITCKIYAYTLNYDIETNVYINKALEREKIDSGEIGLIFKSYFDPAIHAFNEVSVSVYSYDLNVTTALQKITEPSNAKGIGGLPVAYVAPTPLGAYGKHDVRVSTGSPKFLEYIGKRIPFVNMGSYHQATFEIGPDWPDRVWDYFWISY